MGLSEPVSYVSGSSLVSFRDVLAWLVNGERAGLVGTKNEVSLEQSRVLGLYIYTLPQIGQSIRGLYFTSREALVVTEENSHRSGPLIWFDPVNQAPQASALSTELDHAPV